jgi:3-deoxy-D-manno-octulosonic-acid transferase
MFGAGRPILALASTRDGEEAVLLDALARANTLPPTLLVVLIPRHPQRFDAVASLLAARGLRFVRRSANAEVAADVRVVLGDSLGEMLAYYGASDVAFVAGSLLPFGGQNLIEPIAVGTPTLVGPHVFNFQQASDAAKSAGACVQVADADALFATASRLLSDDGSRQRMRECATAFVAAHRGAIDRLWTWLSPRLDAARARANPADAD